MSNLMAMLAMMFFIVLGIAFIGGCLFVFLDIVLQSSNGNDSERRL